MVPGYIRAYGFGRETHFLCFSVLSKIGSFRVTTVCFIYMLHSVTAFWEEDNMLVEQLKLGYIQWVIEGNI